MGEAGGEGGPLLLIYHTRPLEIGPSPWRGWRWGLSPLVLNATPAVNHTTELGSRAISVSHCLSSWLSYQWPYIRSDDTAILMTAIRSPSALHHRVGRRGETQLSGSRPTKGQFNYMAGVFIGDSKRANNDINRIQYTPDMNPISLVMNTVRRH